MSARVMTLEDINSMPEDTKTRLARETSLFIRRLINSGELRNEDKLRSEVCSAK